MILVIFFFNEPATTEIYTHPLHDALPILPEYAVIELDPDRVHWFVLHDGRYAEHPPGPDGLFRSEVVPWSSRLTASHQVISIAILSLALNRIVARAAPSELLPLSRDVTVT